MALINCSECGYEFSDKADACPKCGCPNTPGGMTPITPPETKARTKRGMGPLKIVLLVLVAIPLLPLSVMVVTALLQALNNLLWQLSYVLPSWLVGPIALIVPALSLMMGVWLLTKLLRQGR